MELELQTLQSISIDLPDYKMICACSHEHNIAILYSKKIVDGYHYLLKKYDANLHEIASCEFQKKLAYDAIRMYRNICILVNYEGGYEKGRFYKNVLLITPQGIELKEFPVGMGLNAISVSAQGTLWCGYDNDGKYKEFVPNISKGNSCIIAAWNFFGELVYELDCPMYDSKFGFFHDCYSIYAPDNKDVYFFYYDKFDLCHLHALEEKELINFEGEHLRPFNFTIKDQNLWILFEPYLDDLKSLEWYQIHNNQLIHKANVPILLNKEEVKNYQLYFNEDTILIHHESMLYCKHI